MMHRKHGRTPIDYGQCLGKSLFNDSSAVGIIIIAFRECPNTMQVVRKNHPRINVKKPAFAGFFGRLPKDINRAD